MQVVDLEAHIGVSSVVFFLRTGMKPARISHTRRRGGNKDTLEGNFDGPSGLHRNWTIRRPW